MELRARARSSNPNATTPSRPALGTPSRVSASKRPREEILVLGANDAGEDVNDEELELGINHGSVLDKMLRGQFATDVEEEEEDDDDD